MKMLAFAVTALTLTSSLQAQAAPRVATSLPPAELSALEKIRKDVWVNWFAGDTAALRRSLGPELVAISPDSKHWQSLDETLAGSARFKASGQTLRSVSFDSNTVHRLGNVVVMFSHYRLVMEGNGQQSVQAGRATEVFVRHNNRWVHTSWHLDVLP